MARSRADERLEGWKTVARSASKPADAPRPHPNRTALPFGFLGAAAIALVLIVGLSARGPRSRAADLADCWRESHRLRESVRIADASSFGLGAADGDSFADDACADGVTG